MTGRELILQAASGIIDLDTAQRLAEGIGALGYVCVPRKPTEKMLEGAYWDAFGQDASEVWGKMISVSEGEMSDLEIYGLVKEPEKGV